MGLLARAHANPKLPTTTTCPPKGSVARKGARRGQQQQEQAARAQRAARVQTKVQTEAARAEEMEFEDEDEEEAEEAEEAEDVELGAKPATQKAKVELTPGDVPGLPPGGEEPIHTNADDTDNDGNTSKSFSIVGDAWETKPASAKPTYRSAEESMHKEGEAWAAKVHESMTNAEEASSTSKPASHHSAPRATHAEDADTEVAAKEAEPEPNPNPNPNPDPNPNPTILACGLCCLGAAQYSEMALIWVEGPT